MISDDGALVTLSRCSMLKSLLLLLLSVDPLAVDIEPDVQGLRDVESNLKAEARNADLLMIWTDCDREGEHIGSEIMAVCRSANRNLRVKRARFSAIIAAWVYE